MSFLGGMTRVLLLLSAAWLGIVWTGQATASELKVEAVLVWGTDDDKPSDPNLKPVDKDTVERLRKIFVWKNYYEVRRKKAVIPSRGSSRIRMSDKCEVEIKELAGPKVEYQLIGQGKRVLTAEANFVKGEKLCFAGEDKGRTAWFVVMTLLE